MTATHLEGDGPLVMVDDSQIDITLMQRYHAKSAVPNDFVSFTSGPAFHDHMRAVKAGEAPMPALVLLDINMPLQDGFEVLAQLRDDPAFTTMPVVVFLSNSDNIRDIERCRELNASFQEKFLRATDAVAFLNSLVPPPSS